MIGGMGTSADAGDAPAGQGPTLYLPEPTGPCPVGTASLCLEDVSRPDPWAAGVSARELMVSVWYPAARSLDITRAYVRAFFDQHLRSKPQALLDQPSPRYPEVTFSSPD
jgi:hypothetical protein